MMTHAEYDRGQWKTTERVGANRWPSGRHAHSTKRGRQLSRVGRAFPLRLIRSEVELDRAIAVIDSLIAREDLDLEQEDYLDVLGDLVHKYKAEHNPLVAVSDSDMVRFLADSE